MSDEAKLKQSLREKAMKDLEVWYEQRAAEIEKQKIKNRAAESNEPEERSGQSPDASARYVLHSNHLLRCFVVDGSVSQTLLISRCLLRKTRVG